MNMGGQQGRFFLLLKGQSRPLEPQAIQSAARLRSLSRVAFTILLPEFQGRSRAMAVRV
jgi:hypothetical protein